MDPKKKLEEEEDKSPILQDGLLTLEYNSQTRICRSHLTKKRAVAAFQRLLEREFSRFDRDSPAEEIDHFKSLFWILSTLKGEESAKYVLVPKI